MSAQRQPRRFVPDAVVSHNRKLEELLKRRWHVTLATYKTIEALAELALVALAFYVILEGGDPMLTFSITAVVIGGWKVVEFFAVYADDIARARETFDDSGGD